MASCYVCGKEVDLSADYEVRDGQPVRVDDRERWLIELPAFPKFDGAIHFHRSCHQRFTALREEVRV